MKKALLVLSLSLAMAGCTYLGGTIQQTGYSIQTTYSPAQRVYKHMLDANNFFVFGKIENSAASSRNPVAVVALSDRYQQGEVVDVSHFSRAGSYYGLNLPEGDYRLVVVRDLNQDGFYDGAEAIGGRSLSLRAEKHTEMVVGGYDIDLTVPLTTPQNASFHVAVPQAKALAESLFYPKGTIRALDDEIFSERMARLGMYKPAEFMEAAPMMFYALEEDLGYKVPVVFVNGIGGSPANFAEIVAKLDRSRYRPWFFYYPSGYRLKQSSEMFYKIFLSGQVIPLGDMPMIIVAHSMGGLVVRDALNRQTGKETETKVKTFITLASPIGGHPSAKMASQGPLMIPSWLDVAPDSAFMNTLRRKKLPGGLQYHLLYAYGNTSTLKLGENSDGVVPLSSQLHREAQDESTAQYGFNTDHTGILKDPDALRRIKKIIEDVKPPYPEDHMQKFLQGGYDVALEKEYSALGAYCIRTVGHWMAALEAGAIAPLDPFQTHFVQVCRHEATPDTEPEKDWLTFKQHHPDIR